MPRIGGFGATELIIVLVIVLIIFGVGRLPQAGGALGKGIRQFRRGVQGKDEEEESAPAKVKGGGEDTDEEATQG